MNVYECAHVPGLGFQYQVVHYSCCHTVQHLICNQREQQYDTEGTP